MNKMSAKTATVFWAVLFLVLWIGNAYLRVPLDYISIGSIIAGIVFIALPIAGIFAASALKWNPWVALALVVVFLSAVALLADNDSAVFSGIAQVARIGWPLCLGVLISLLIKDKNLLLPIALVLATVDILAVMSPAGTVKHGLQSETIRPIFDTLAYQVPKVGSLTPAAQMGPADPLFLGMFFFALHRFHMRTRQTAMWMVPALAVYLLVVLAFGNQTLLGVSLGALPALVPIGIVVLLVNRKEFALSKSEAAMVWFVAILCVAVIVASFWIWRPKHQATQASHSVAPKLAVQSSCLRA